MDIALARDPQPGLTELINQAYLEGEKGLWRAGAVRISEPELAELIGRGEIAVARQAGRLAGCVRVVQPERGVGELGLLAVAPSQQGSGAGRGLVRFAEQWARDRGLPVMQLQLLVPATGEHPVKQFLRAWYTRLGFRLVDSGEVAGHHPDLAPLLAVECRFLTFHKDLRPL
ncbi:GNAT family N-acetyltransferase [Actinoplanes sp. TFC3]|uniref:GNAT family N-acetyltransferase n=1 Tax=Actinoplanes sp. TFC3 TaxID=1710355 RepID=UPI0008299CAB|nr:GNAT family N-acetyltransferase [Actinoplanes sp. TFC3]